MKTIIILFMIVMAGCEDHYSAAQTYEAKIYIANCLENGESSFESNCANNYLKRKKILDRAKIFRAEAESIKSLETK